MLKPPKNPLLFDREEPAVNLEKIQSPTVHRRKLRTAKREIRDLRRKQTAAEALAGLDHETEIYGFTKGQFSFIDIIEHCLTITGPARLQISTWTAAAADISSVLDLCRTKMLTDARWLVDLTFQRRSPELANQIRMTFGDDAIRVAKNHAKFILLDNDDWQIICRTSMNINFNPRFENFQIAHDPEMWQFHHGIFDEIWRKQKRDVADWRPYEIHKHFDDEM
jgi:hypothetical protein